MLASGSWRINSSSKAKKQAKTQLSDDELRRRIFANTAVLFPDSAAEPGALEIVYGTRDRVGESEEPPWQYAMVVRRNQVGTFTPLIKGQAWSTSTPWSMVLQGLLDTTATLIHKTIGQAPMPQLGILETLPRYEPRASGYS